MNKAIKQLRDDLIKRLPPISDDEFDLISATIETVYIRGQIDGNKEAHEIHIEAIRKSGL